MKNRMTKDEFNNKLFSEFSLEELSQINPKIYHNPDHIKYYEKYHSENYQWCFNYLIKNRSLLSN